MARKKYGKQAHGTIITRRPRRKNSKGMDEALWWAIDIVLILFSLLLLKAILGNFSPDRQIAMLNTELLRSKMDEACLNGQATMEKFSLPQPKPTQLWGISDVLPRFAISVLGDPHYVLYYEAFPPGEGIGWEVYSNFPERYIATFDARNYDELKDKLKKEKDKIEESDANTFITMMREYENAVTGSGGSFTEKNTLVSNIVLNEYMNVIPTEEPESGTQFLKGDEIKGSLGAPSENNPDFFEFTEYYTKLTKEERAFVKYRPCGAYSLCLKTKEGVYRFPLEQCKKAGIQYVQLVYDARDLSLEDLTPAGKTTIDIVGAKGFGKIGKWVGKVPMAGKFLKPIPGIGQILFIFSAIFDVAEQAQNILTFSLRYKVSDFNLASPCKLDGNIEIIKTNCAKSDDKYSCEKGKLYPVYNYNVKGDKRTIEYAGNNFACLDSISIDRDEPEKYGKELPCLRIYMKDVKRSDFCWTNNPTVHSKTALEQITGFLQIPTKLLVGWGDPADFLVYTFRGLQSLPVTSTTEYMAGTKAIVMKPSGIKSMVDLSEVGKQLFNLNWAWPGGVSEIKNPIW